MKEKKAIAVGIILHATLDQVFIAQRDAKASQGALWEFPGGKVEAGESVKQALIRELEEEIGIIATDVEHFIALTHDYGDKVLDFDFFLIHKYQGIAYGKELQTTRWVNIEDLANYPFPAANLPVLNAVKSRFSGTT